MTKWIKNAVFYEIYPQSFLDTNGDGIGDFLGIIHKLDYIKSLGCNAIWLNPCYDSPFRDAGYDVRDYKKVASRYGTMEDLTTLFDEVHKRDMHILMDFIPGHTSDEHPWFLESKKTEENEYTHRYIWTDWWLKGADGINYVAGETDRDGAYIVNFFKCQPALNFGFLNPSEDWQKTLDDPACLSTREALKDVMRFWLDKGCDGFRVDMADSLVKKDDDKKSGTVKVWQDILSTIHKEYPNAAFVSEWGRPHESILAGFDMDFYLDWSGNGYNSLLRDYSVHRTPFAKKSKANGDDFSFFKTDSGRTIDAFLDEYLPRYEYSKDKGCIALITGNHDTTRISYNLTIHERKLAFAFLFTMPGTPFMYYGDEIGMRYQLLPNKEGGYTRTGSRTPMQWDTSKNMGFSLANEDDLYLPVDSQSKSLTVAKQEADPDSLLNTFRNITKLRHSEPDLLDNANFVVVSRNPFIYKRGSILMAVNPTTKEKTVHLETTKKEVLLSIGTSSICNNILTLAPQSFIAVKSIQ